MFVVVLAFKPRNNGTHISGRGVRKTKNYHTVARDKVEVVKDLTFVEFYRINSLVLV
jgi:hypothetical protein